MTGSGKTDQLAQAIIFAIYIADDRAKNCLRIDMQEKFLWDYTLQSINLAIAQYQYLLFSQSLSHNYYIITQITATCTAINLPTTTQQCMCWGGGVKVLYNRCFPCVMQICVVFFLQTLLQQVIELRKELGWNLNEEWTNVRRQTPHPNQIKTKSLAHKKERESNNPRLEERSDVLICVGDGHAENC